MNVKLATFSLVLVAACWGLTFPLVELAVKSCDPILFVALRFTLAALPVLPFFLKNVNRQFLFVGAVIGLMNLGAFVFQTVGLLTVNASRAAFLTGIYVLMIPFLSPLLKMGKPKLHDIISAFICLVGIYVLTGCNIGEFCLGDTWIVIGDLFIAVSIIYIGKRSKDNMDPYMLAYGQIVMTALFAWVPALLLTDLDFTSLTVPTFTVPLVICSFLCTILAIVLQSKYQKYVTIQNTALIFSLEPVFASIFDTMLTSTPPTLYTIFGGVIILASILYLELYKTPEEPVREVSNN